ncbi:septation protein SepH [Nocardioides pantholopis]|uniref:septation protein SepH n=1 Tax=Nocardioides pantholopis TaxID=2483798 RepID=UPI000FDC25BD|nr:septation protein SepH [Nocardioides pantholopis]
MAHLRLSGVSGDGKRLLLTDETGQEHDLEIDGRIRDAVRDHSRARRGETPMESTLRPRDIQARIRAGETPEAVAEAAQTTVDRIMAFAAPVLAEREHVAQRAQRSTVRRRSEGSGTARTLGEAVTAQLRSVNVDPDTVEWDAWRREDNRWTLAAGYAATERSGTAHFTFDMPGSYVVLDDDDARWLVGDLVGSPEPAAVHDDLGRVRQRRLSAVRGDDDELPLGVDAIELVRDESDSPEAPVEAFLEEQPGLDETALVEEAADAAAQDEDPEPEVAPEPEPAPPVRRSVRKRGGRASVPSWDEIMFGGGKQE